MPADRDASLLLGIDQHEGWVMIVDGEFAAPAREPPADRDRFGHLGSRSQEAKTFLKQSTQHLNVFLTSLFFWFSSELVVASLVDFQGKVAQVVEAVSFSFNDLDFVIDPFQFAGVDGVIAVVEYPVAMTLEHFGEAV